MSVKCRLTDQLRPMIIPTTTSALGHKPPNTFKVGDFRFALLS
jgi:hypothetical protein